MLYQIVGSIRYKEFLRIREDLRYNDKTESANPIQLATEYDKLDWTSNESQGRRQSVDGVPTQFEKENDGFQRMGKNENSGRKISSDGGRSNASDGNYRQNDKVNRQYSVSMVSNETSRIPFKPSRQEVAEGS